jgi:hypothetical protein
VPQTEQSLKPWPVVRLAAEHLLLPIPIRPTTYCCLVQQLQSSVVVEEEEERMASPPPLLPTDQAGLSCLSVAPLTMGQLGMLVVAAEGRVPVHRSPQTRERLHIVEVPRRIHRPAVAAARRRRLCRRILTLGHCWHMTLLGGCYGPPSLDVYRHMETLAGLSGRHIALPAEKSHIGVLEGLPIGDDRLVVSCPGIY